MRRNFVQVLKEGKIDLKNEYCKLFSLFYDKDRRDKKSIAELVSDNFDMYYFRGTCLTLEEFDRTYGFNFVEQPSEFDVNYLVSFMEYIYNFIICTDDDFFFYNSSKSLYLNQIQLVVEKIGYEIVYQDDFCVFIPKDNTVTAVAESESIPDKLAYKVLEYNHYSMKGNIEAKRETLIKLADILEAKKDKLNEINKSFAKDLFYLINSCNVRHNNKAEESKYHHRYIEDINDNELEQIYDEIYRMCLLAFMQLEHIGRKKWLDEIKSNIANLK